jgi:4-carboxymuconolactone decarboxylase
MAAKAVGLSDTEVEQLLSDQVPLFEDPVDRTVAETARAMLKTGDLSDHEYAVAVAQLGERGVFEITVLVGFYEAIALQLRVFRVIPE